MILNLFTEIAVHILGNMFVDTVYPPDEDEHSQNAQIRIPVHYLKSHNATGLQLSTIYLPCIHVVCNTNLFTAIVNILFATVDEILPNENE